MMRTIERTSFAGGRIQGLIALCVLVCVPAAGISAAAADESPADGAVIKAVLGDGHAGENLLDSDAWRPWEKGFVRKDGLLICDNGTDAEVQRGASQTVALNQNMPEPIMAVAWSRAVDVTGGRDRGYSLYLDLVYEDGEPLWGQIDAFDTGTHEWQKAQVIVFPDKPVRTVSFHLLLRRHAGRALFRDVALYTLKPPAGACLFDGVAVAPSGRTPEGFQVRDVAAGSGFMRIERSAAGLRLQCEKTRRDDATFFDVVLRDTTGEDRAVTLVYAIPFSRSEGRWFADPRSTTAVQPGREYVNASRFNAGANGRLSRYPLAAAANSEKAVALGIDMRRPAFFRLGCNAGTEELFVAYDLGLTKEKPSARVRFCTFSFDPKWGFRAALDRYYSIFSEAFERRIEKQGLWMPFAKISEVVGWEDFGFRFKEGTNETAWDDAHGIITFRYTEPMTWWMSMPEGMPRTIAAALQEAKRLVGQGDTRAQALLTSGYHDQAGRYVARLLDRPWCDGAVWSINSMLGIAGEVTDFKNQWGPQVQRRLYGPDRKADLDGEYIDSSEGYVTDELDFRRDHFAAAQTPLTFSLADHSCAIFRGLIAFEYIRALSEDCHAMDKLMMANSTPIRLCWLAPLLDVMGSETDWNPGGTWRPMSDADLLYRRVMCKGKPYCFLMNTRFEQFSHALVEKYMKRALAYGMFPGFFSHNASQGHYFTRRELYDRDRDLFTKYVPLCRRVAEAGWEPVTRATCDQEYIRIERFGDQYLTIFNDSKTQTTATIRTEMDVPDVTEELLHGRRINWNGRSTTLVLGAEDVAVIRLD